MLMTLILIFVGELLYCAISPVQFQNNITLYAHTTDHIIKSNVQTLHLQVLEQPQISLLTHANAIRLQTHAHAFALQAQVSTFYSHKQAQAWFKSHLYTPRLQKHVPVTRLQVHAHSVRLQLRP